MPDTQDIREMEILELLSTDNYFVDKAKAKEALDAFTASHVKRARIESKLEEAKLYRKSYPKSVARANDPSKTTRADLDRRIGDLSKELEENYERH